MTTTSARFFDELAKMMTNAAGAAQGLRGEMDTLFRTQAERVLNELEVVQREVVEGGEAGEQRMTLAGTHPGVALGGTHEHS